MGRVYEWVNDIHYELTGENEDGEYVSVSKHKYSPLAEVAITFDELCARYGLVTAIERTATCKIICNFVDTKEGEGEDAKSD